MSLENHILEIQQGIKSGQYLNEASVSQGIILRLLNALKWPTYDTQIVSPEFTVEGRRVDYALCYRSSRQGCESNGVKVPYRQLPDSDG